MEQTRDIKVTATLERQGDVKALRETAKDLEALAPAARQAEKSLSTVDDALDVDAILEKAKQIRKALESIPNESSKAKDGISGLGKAAKGLDLENIEGLFKTLSSLGDALSGKEIDDFGESLSDLQGSASGAEGKLAKLSVALETLRVSFAITRSAITLLKDRFAIDVDAMVSSGLKLEELAEKVLGLQEDLSQRADLLRNQEKLFENFDLEGFSDDAERNAEIIDAAFRKIGLAAVDAKELLSRFNLNGDALVRQAEEFAQGFEAALQVKPDLDLEAFGERAKGQIQGLLDSLIAAGEQIPSEFQRMANQLGILPSEVEAQFNQLNGFLTSFNLDTEALLTQAEEFSVNFRKALELNPDLNLEGFSEKAKSTVQALLDNLIIAGEQIPPALQSVADQLGIVPSAVEEHLGQANASAQRILSELPGIFTESREQLEIEAAGFRKALEELGGFQGVFQLDPEAKAELKEQIEEMVNTYRSFGEKVDPLIADHANRLGVIVGAWERASEGVDEQGRRMSDAARQMADEIDQAALAQEDSITVVIERLTEAGEVMITQKKVTREMAEAMTLQQIKEASPELRAYAEAVQEAQRQLILAGGSADEAATELKKPGDEASEAGSKVSELASASDELAQAARDAGTSLDEQAVAIERVSKAANVDGIVRMREELSLFGEVQFADGIVNQLDEIISKADETFSALQRLNQAGQDNSNGSTPEPTPTNEVIV